MLSLKVAVRQIGRLSAWEAGGSQHSTQVSMESVPPRGSGWVPTLNADGSWLGGEGTGPEGWLVGSGRLRTAKLVLAILICAMGLSGCETRVGAGHLHPATANSGFLSQEEKHRLYTAALAASDAPLDTALFKEVCQKIGIFDAAGNPNEIYMTFVREHVQWGMRAETNQFRSEINTKEKAQEYVLRHLP